MDAFAGLDGLGGSASNKKLSLADQLKAEEASKRSAAQAWDSLDLLDSAFQSRPSPTPRVAPAVQSRAGFASGLAESSASGSASGSASQSVASSIADDDVFGLFSSAPPAPPQQGPKSTPQPVASADIPRQPRASAKATPEPSRRRSPALSSSSSSSSSSPSSAAAAAAPSTSRSMPQAAKPQASKPAGFDRGLAYLVDMGFEPEDASRALTAMDGQVSGAVNYLMAEAQGLPLPKPRQSTSQQLANLGNADFSEFSAAASQFGSSMFSKASNWWSKGRRELEKAYNQYNGEPQGDPNQPAWMRDKAKYDARKTRFDRDDPSRTRSSAPVSASNSDPDLSRAPRSRSEAPREEEPSMPQRPSRAELFRRKQMERGSGSREPSAGQRSSSAASPEMQAAPSAVPEPEPAIDLLNLSGQPAQPQLTSSQTDMYADSRALGSEAYKKGNYESAVEHYTAALAVVPDGNVLRALLLSNRSAALMKAGNARGAFDDTDDGIKLLPNKGAGLEVEGKPMTDIWLKLVTRNAQAAEQMEKYEVALTSWQLLLDNGYATPAVLESKRRCQKALNPSTVAAAEAPAKPKAKRRGWGTTGAAPSSESGKAALEKVRNEHKQIQEDEKQRELLRDRVSGRVDAWKAGNETNLRNLLATLQIVLWEGSGWTPVAAAELVVPKKVRIVYMKAVSRTHPDKVPSTAPMEVRMISESVFVTIQKAWEVFREENNL